MLQYKKNVLYETCPKAQRILLRNYNRFSNPTPVDDLGISEAELSFDRALLASDWPRCRNFCCSRI